MNLSQALRIIPSFLFLMLSAYLFVEIAAEQTYNWRFYLALIALGIYALLVIFFVWALVLKRNNTEIKQGTKTSFPLRFGLLMGCGIGLFSFAICEIKYILFLAPLLGLVYGFILMQVEKKRMTLT